MSLTIDDKKKAQFLGFVTLDLSKLYTREHLPDNNIRSYFPTLTDFDWNTLISMLVMNVRHQPFADPYYWQTEDRHSFTQWLNSWKV